MISNEDKCASIFRIEYRNMNTRIRSSNAKIEKIFKFQGCMYSRGRMPKI